MYYIILYYIILYYIIIYIYIYVYIFSLNPNICSCLTKSVVPQLAKELANGKHNCAANSARFPLDPPLSDAGLEQA